MVYNYSMEKNQNIEDRKKSRHLSIKKLLLRFCLSCLFAALLAAVFVFSASYVKKTFLTEKKEVREALVSKELLSAQELISQKYRYSDIITLKKSLGFSKSYSIVRFSGIIRAGISDISKADFSVYYTEGGKPCVKIELPFSEILGNEIVEQSVFDEKRSVFVPITVQEIFDEIDAVRASVAEEIVDGGFLDEANAAARKTVSAMMYAAGFDIVEVDFKK